MRARQLLWLWSIAKSLVAVLQAYLISRNSTNRPQNSQCRIFVQCHYSAEGTVCDFTSEVSMGNKNFVCDVSIFFPYPIFIIAVYLVGSKSFFRQRMHYTGCPRRNGQNLGRVFFMLNYTDITQNTYIQSWTVTEIMAIEKCGRLGCPRTVSRPWRRTHTLRMPGNEKPLGNIGMQWPWRDNAQLRPV